MSSWFYFDLFLSCCQCYYCFIEYCTWFDQAPVSLVVLSLFSVKFCAIKFWSFVCSSIFFLYCHDFVVNSFVLGFDTFSSVFLVYFRLGLLSAPPHTCSLFHLIFCLSTSTLLPRPPTLRSKWRESWVLLLLFSILMFLNLVHFQSFLFLVISTFVSLPAELVFLSFLLRLFLMTPGGDRSSTDRDRLTLDF